MGHVVLVAALIVLGPVLLAAGVADLLRRRRFDARAVRTTGTVVACARRPGLESDRPVYALRVRFTTPTGETVEFADDSAAAWTPGTPVEVRHAPEPPWPARVADGTSGSVLRPYGFLLAGVMATAGLVMVTVHG